MYAAQVFAVRELVAGVMGARLTGAAALGRLAEEKEPVRGAGLGDAVEGGLVLLLQPVHLGSVERHWE